MTKQKTDMQPAQARPFHATAIEALMRLSPSKLIGARLQVRRGVAARCSVSASPSAPLFPNLLCLHHTAHAACSNSIYLILRTAILDQHRVWTAASNRGLDDMLRARCRYLTIAWSKSREHHASKNVRSKKRQLCNCPDPVRNSGTR